MQREPIHKEDSLVRTKQTNRKVFEVNSRKEPLLEDKKVRLFRFVPFFIPG
jgi:hypothetical protein